MSEKLCSLKKILGGGKAITIDDLLILSSYASGTQQISVSIDLSLYKIHYLLYHGSYVERGGYLGIYKNISTTDTLSWEAIQTPSASYNPRQSGNTITVGVNNTGRYTCGVFVLYSTK